VRRLLAFVTLTLGTFLLMESVSRATDAPVLVKGRVNDENGLPIGGAQVKLELANGQNFAAVTDDAGFFSFPNISAGEYAIRIEKQGFFVLANQKIQVSASNTDFAFTLNHEEEVREKIDVTTTENRIDPASTQSTASLSATEIRDIPVASSHDLTQSLIAIPEVVKDNSDLIHVAGSRNTTELYTIDGVEVGDPADNGLSARMIVEAVRTAEIQTGRFGAEYAHPGAAVLSYETREGDDRWRFNATDFIPGINIQDGVQLGNFYPRVVLSGPIVKDSLWFAQSFDVIHTLAFEKGLPSGQNFATNWGGDSWSKLLWKISTNNSLHVSFLANVNDETNAGLTALNPQSTTQNVSSRLLFGSLKEQSYIHKTLFEFGVGVERSINNAYPKGDQAYVLLVDGSEGNYFQTTKEQASRYQLFTDAISTPLKWLGAHTLSAGANLASVDFSQSSVRGEIEALRADLTLDRLTTFTGNPSFSLSNTQAGGFAQDSWVTGSHVVTQIGVRADWDRLFQAVLVQPRLALNLLPFSDKRAKFSIGWGMYNIPLNLSVIGQAYDQAQVDTLYNAAGTAPIDGPATSRFILPANGLTSLQQPYFNIASAGYEQKMGANTLVKLELLARDEHHGLVYETLSPGQIGSDFLLQSSRRDKYRGVTISARHTFANTTEVFGSYTRSRASTDQVLDPVLGSLYFAPQQAGPLLWDAPNRFLQWASVPTPIWGILFTDLFEYRTGYPYSAVNQQQFLVGVPNSFRFPAYASLTVGFEKRFTFKDRVFAARLSVVNIFDRQNADVVVNNVDAPNFGTFEGGQGRAVTARLRFVGRK
jgi:Carboxypeptidase regulatory-like domain